ncbi:hypothetical protein FNV43_RR24036 [Rhamnella rubrinervis]|uniref:non-specific serine/threonine protein kinase n=1 Tax=Rhamnella rubrinervis TaxID=2594499 RepID=A0A8K0DRR1_9ROSA|nr:hypothetical protein FNV43_RR24036 [Rhamnella rubrinervis]
MWRNFVSDAVSPAIYSIEVVNEFPHDPAAFTQGLLYDGNGILFESTGLYGQSSVRKVALRTGKVEVLQKMDDSDFGEGLTLLGKRLFQVTWMKKTGYIYDRYDLSKFEEFTHQMEDGWGLATDGKVLFGSDGTSTLYKIDPQTLKVTHKGVVKFNGHEVHSLNELEFINGEVWANVWQTDCIARISPEGGNVLGWILLQNLREGLIAAGNKGIDVLNGIAWDSNSSRIFGATEIVITLSCPVFINLYILVTVTGKLWPKLYEIKECSTAFTSERPSICRSFIVVKTTEKPYVVYERVMCLIHYRRRKSYKSHLCFPTTIASKDRRNAYSTSSLDSRLLPLNISEIEMNARKLTEHRPVLSDQLFTQASGRSCQNNMVTDMESTGKYSPAVRDVWRGSRFSLMEIEVATNGFAKENLIDNEENGSVYRGILLDSTRVAVKRLESNSCQAEEFLAEVKAIGYIRHKNLVKMLGYCIEGAYRMLVYEYVDNGNLHFWIHGCSSQASPLTWSIRMNIIQGIAKGLAYLHEDVEPKILHRSLKSSNILLDRHWNPKISDFGLDKLYGQEWGLMMMETTGYIAPEDASPGAFTEKTDVYSFGILIMEIISGRSPVDHNQPQPYLIDWMKSMVSGNKIPYVVDRSMPEMPSSKELKRILLIALRCVDPDLKDRPKMGEIIHMLEPRDLLLGDDCWLKPEDSSCCSPEESHTTASLCESPFETPKGETDSNCYQKYYF